MAANKSEFTPHHIIESKDRQLNYADEFRTFLAETPGSLNAVLECINEAEKHFEGETDRVQIANGKYHNYILHDDTWYYADEESKLDESLDEGIASHNSFSLNGPVYGNPDLGIRVQSLGHSRKFLYKDGRPNAHSDYYKLAIKNKDFFIKKSTDTWNPGHNEFKSSLKALEIAKELGDVEIVDFQLGYTDKNASYFVSRWIDLSEYVRLDVYLWEKFEGYDCFSPQSQSVKKRFKVIAEKFKQWFDFGEVNCFYNPNIHKFLLLDLSQKKQRYRQIPNAEKK